MPGVTETTAELEKLRASLIPPFKAAKARGDQTEMERLSALAGEIDDALDDLAILGIAAVAARLGPIRAKVEEARKRIQASPFGGSFSGSKQGDTRMFDASPLDQDRPSRASLGETIDDQLSVADEPMFVTLAEVKHKFLGARPRGLEGAIVHYDAGRTRPTKGLDDEEWGAKNTLLHGQNNGFAYATISRSGKIYIPGNMDWGKWGSHAGKSRCPSTGREAVSQFYVGFEINSPGLVYPTADSETFVPWFDAVRDSTGTVILNEKGQAKVARADGELYKKSQVRAFSTQTANIRPGFYVPYTAQQYRALFTVLLWLKRNFKKSFRLDFVFGHDEVSPGRKVDPGGSLGKHRGAAPGPATTMPELRAELLKAWADQQSLVA